MLEQIRNCQKCGLCLNQRPLLENKNECQIFWVGLSAKMTKTDGEIPLSPTTNTGMVIEEIEGKLGEVVTYRTNLVKCVPLNEHHKLRYPNQKEINCCIPNLQKEIEELHPKIVFLLGEKVYSSVGKYLGIEFEKWKGYDYHYKEHDGVYYVPVHHPSYIYVYKRREVEQYVNSVAKIAKKLLQA